MQRLLVAVAVLAAIAAGCAQKKSETASERPAPGAAAPAMDASAMDQAPATGSAKPVPEGVELTPVTLAGKVGCGHCTYHVTGSCALAMQADDGKVYVIENDPEHDAHFADRFSGKAIKVTGRAGELEGKWVVYAEKVELK